MALDRAREAAALRGADDVDEGAGFEDLDRQRLADLEVGRGGLEALLAEEALRRGADLLRGLRLGLVRDFLADVFETDLDGVVAVALRGAELGHDTGSRLDDGHRGDRAVVGEELRHASLTSKK